jgi:hypothetical protein
MRSCASPARGIGAVSPHAGDPYAIAPNVSAETLGHIGNPRTSSAAPPDRLASAGATSPTFRQTRLPGFRMSETRPFIHYAGITDWASDAWFTYDAEHPDGRVQLAASRSA